MKRHSRLLPIGITLAVFGLVLVLLAWPVGSPLNTDQALAEQAQANLDKVWPMFGGTFSRNMVNTFEKNIPDDFSIERKDFKGKILSQAKNLKWQAALGSRAYGGPVIVGGKIYVGTNNHYPRNPKIKGDKGVLMCFRESDGQFLWQMVTDKLPSGQVNDWEREGVCSTPIVDGNRVYYVSNRCDVVCLDPEGLANGNDGDVKDEKYQDKTDGDVIWRFEMMKELNVFPHNMAACAPMIVGDLIYVVTANGVDAGHINIPSPNAPSFIALNKKTGKLVWQDNSPGKLIMHGQWSNPTYAVTQVAGKDMPQVIFPGGDGWLYSFEPASGKLIWKFDANPKDSEYELGGMGTRSDFIATPVVVGDHLFIGTGQDPEHYEGIGHLWCIDINKASTKGGDVSPDLVTDAKKPVKFKPNPNAAVVWHYGGPYSKDDAAKFGRDYPFGRTMSTVAVHDGLVYAGELAGFLHVLDAKTGKHLWQHDLKAAIWGSALWVDGKVYIATEDGDAWVFAHGREKKEPKRVEFGQPIRSTPVVANGVLYIMSESHLFAIGK